MKKIFILLPILALLPLAACSGEGKTSVVEKDEYYVIKPGKKAKSVSVVFKGENGDLLNYKHSYSDEYFSNEFPEKLNLNLAKTSLALAMSSCIPEASQYVSDIGFKDVASQVLANKASEEDSVVTLFAHKTIGEREMVAVSVRGYDYKEEWSSNMTVGLEDDHEGFYNAAFNVIYELKDYLDEHELGDNLSFWFAGYSRGGATVNLVSKYLTQEASAHLERTFDTDHVYTYTFEAPKCALEDEEHDYSFIHNLYNKRDFIAMNFQFDFTLMGNMHEYTHLATSKSDVIANGKKIDPNFDIPVFKNKKLDLWSQSIADDTTSTVTEDEFYQIALDMLYRDLSDLEPEQAEGLVDVHTRENYVNNIQGAFKYVLALAFSLTDEQSSALVAYVKDHVMEIFGTLSDETGEDLYEFLTVAFAEANIEYKEEELKPVCAQVVPYVRTLMLYGEDSAGLLKYVPTFAGNFSLIYTNHYMTTAMAYLDSIPLK